MSAQHTPGPWRAGWSMAGSWLVYIGDIVLNLRGAEREADARLIAAAPALFAELRKRVDDVQQGLFEDWLAETCPSGGVEQVQAQWEQSSSYREFCSTWGGALDALDEAAGAQS